VTRTTLTVPAEIVPTVYRGALNELSFAAEVIGALCEPSSEKPDGEYEETFESTFEHFVAAYGLLTDIGYRLPDPPVAVGVNLVKHLWILLRVMGGQRQADIELAADMTPSEQSAATHRVHILDTLINAVATEYE
jgi:hypothetical protein